MMMKRKAAAPAAGMQAGTRPGGDRAARGRGERKGRPQARRGRGPTAQPRELPAQPRLPPRFGTEPPPPPRRAALSQRLTWGRPKAAGGRRPCQRLGKAAEPAKGGQKAAAPMTLRC